MDKYNSAKELIIVMDRPNHGEAGYLVEVLLLMREI